MNYLVCLSLAGGAETTESVSNPDSAAPRSAGGAEGAASTPQSDDGTARRAGHRSS